MNPQSPIPATYPASHDRIVAYVALLEELEALQRELVSAEKAAAKKLKKINAHLMPSAVNLIHYLALRRRDVRPLQKKLAAAGLSSMGRAESHVLDNLHNIVVLLQHALGKPIQKFPSTAIDPSSISFRQLEENTNALFGHAAPNRWSRIMVALPTEAASQYQLVREMLLEGMNCARINCAHDDPSAWKSMVEHVRQASRETGRPCRVLMDLAGPKLRTGEIAPGPGVIKCRPHRDIYGNLIAPARIWLYPEGKSASFQTQADACVPVEEDWLRQLMPREVIKFVDARGSRRSIRLMEQYGAGFWGECDQTAYFKSGIKLHCASDSISGKLCATRTGKVGILPSKPEVIRLRRGDHLILTREQTAGHPGRLSTDGHLVSPATIACSMPEVFDYVKSGERVLFDDGRIGGVVRNAGAEVIVVEITQARDGGEKLLTDKGINLPDTRMEISGLTKTDIAHLPFIVQHADIVGLSFVHRPADIELLQKQLHQLEGQKPGIIIKIETRSAFEQLPELLLTLLRWPVVGVMIARGDLAVECGYERLAEVQEEILWLSEAAHIPVIWATQVLENLARSGKPSRAEVTDAAMSERAECVMLNKGPHIIQAIQMLDNILQRMQQHQHKKRALLRQLHW